MRKVLFVCTGNTCRSPMAAALLRQRAAGRGAALQVDSAGTYAAPGQEASPEAVAALMARGLDLSDHRSRPLTQELIAGADLILAMTEKHKEVVLRLAPEAAPRTFTLAEYAGRPGTDVRDPFGGHTEQYRQTAGQLEELIAGALERLLAEAGENA